MDDEYDSSDSEGFLEPSLSIDSKTIQNYLPTNIPSNGHEYLYSVINETKNCPKTVVAKIKKGEFKGRQNVFLPAESLPKVSQEYLPSELWKEKQIQLFNSVRDEVDRIKPFLSKSSQEHEIVADSDWWSYIYSEDGRIKQLPMVSSVACLDQVSIVSLIELHIEWLEKGKLEFRETVASWIFSLLACLEIPLDPDTCDTLRSLSRYSWNKRAAIISTNCENGTILQSLNLIICLISLFFGQADLAD